MSKHTSTAVHVEERNVDDLPYALWLSSESGYVLAQIEHPGELDRANFRRLAAMWNDLEEGRVVVVPVEVVRRITQTLRWMDATGSRFHCIDAADVDVLKEALSRLQQNGGEGR